MVCGADRRGVDRHVRMMAMEVLKDKYPERRKVLLKKWQEEVRHETGQPQLDVFM